MPLKFSVPELFDLDHSHFSKNFLCILHILGGSKSSEALFHPMFTANFWAKLGILFNSVMIDCK